MQPQKDSTAVHDAIVEAISYAATARLVNQPEWMVGLANRINRFLEASEDESRVRFDGDTFRIEAAS